MLDPRLIRRAYAPQIKLREAELSRLRDRIDEDYSNCLSDHERRMERFQRYYMRWRNRTESPLLGEEQASNFRVPVTQWHVFAKWAKELGALFGDDAEIIAAPVGPSDQRIVKKVSRFMTWRVLNSMRLTNRAAIFLFRKILFGRSHAYSPWERRTFEVPLVTGESATEVDYEGPGFFPLWPDDLILPAESDAETVQDFSFCLRKFRASPDMLLRGEDAGRYQRITDNWEEIVRHAEDREQRDDQDGDRVQEEKDLAEGVTYESNLSSGPLLRVHAWFGRWRKLNSGRDARVENLKYRDRYESDLLIHYLPGLHMIIGVQNLAEMYPRTPNRRPFVESALVRDGSYWCPSFGELLESIEEEVSVTHNLATEAGEMSVGPVIFYKPSSGFDPDTFEYEPRKAVASDDPAGVNVVNMKADLEWPVIATQNTLGYGERVTGITDQNLGRSVDRPNAPRTARQTLALLEEGDVRAALDVEVLKQDMGCILSHLWVLESMYSPESVFFRVTEEEADGLFDVKRGGAYMTSKEFGGRYDFALKFATTVWTRQARKEQEIALYQLDLTNPLIVQSPKALWVLTDKLHRSFGDDRFADSVPEPPDLGLPVKPMEEWTRLLQGEEIHVHPYDDDELHMRDHVKRLNAAREDPERDEDAYRAMVDHLLEHQAQIQQKKAIQILANQMIATLQKNTQTGIGIQPPGMPMGLANIQQLIADLSGGAGTAAKPAGGGAPAQTP